VRVVSELVTCVGGGKRMVCIEISLSLRCFTVSLCVKVAVDCSRMNNVFVPRMQVVVALGMLTLFAPVVEIT
jgi:hypothetical protein